MTYYRFKAEKIDIDKNDKLTSLGEVYIALFIDDSDSVFAIFEDKEQIKEVKKENVET